MGRIAVFVDAGYLFAQGSAALTVTKQPRSTLALDEGAVVGLLLAFAEEKAAPDKVLRIYWYDAVPAQGLGPDHVRLAESDNVKLRLGVLNSYGKQKGVDSFIIADLIELARNRAIDSAVLVSGDDDLRIGVQVAQTFGIRVHLLGIASKEGDACSRLLLREVDTVTRWDDETVAKFLSVRAHAPLGSVSLSSSVARTHAERSSEGDDTLKNAVTIFFTGLSSDDLLDIKTVYEAERVIPHAFDAQLLASCRTALGRDLEIVEKRSMRKQFLSLAGKNA
jgi:uncharacterized LabA/DUF88 family protein